MSVWNFFDMIYCINLYSRNDRLDRCKEFFNRMKIPVFFYRVHKHPISGAQGCYESHLSIFKDAYNRGYNNILIFEDDVIESPYFSIDLIQKGIDFMKKDKKWEIFYFGHQPDIFYNTNYPITNNILKTHSTLTHAYAVSKKYIEKMVDLPYFGMAIDKIFLQNKYSYAIYPMVFYQDENSVSDIPTSAPIRGLRFTEIYSMYISYPLPRVLSFFVFLLLFYGFILFIKK